ncbi:hypothetical protein [Hyphococcus sp.]|uniref:hypothetical protein n=1 Tax=Hyphococcus sp. TaxID=2038636 RepID=UPI003D0B3542
MAEESSGHDHATGPSGAPGLTLARLLKLLLPNGTTDETSGDRTKVEIEGVMVPARFTTPPPLPDIFLIASYITKLAGIAPFVYPGSREASAPGPREYLTVSQDVYLTVEKVRAELKPELAHAKAAAREFDRLSSEIFAVLDRENHDDEIDPDSLDEKERAATVHYTDLLQIAGKCNDIVEKGVGEYWRRFLSHYRCLIGTPQSASGAGSAQALIQHWWQSVIDLLVLSDSLCEGIGFPVPLEGPAPVPSYPAFALDMSIDAQFQFDDSVLALPTLAARVPPEIATVLPKSVTPSVGCSIRSLSMNLALLPPIGATGAQWDICSRSDKADRTPLNILLIPLPYYLHADAFNPEKPMSDRDWTFFNIKPRWLDDVDPSEFVTFVRNLCTVADKEAGKVDAIVFPEASLTLEHCAALEDAIFSAPKGHPFFEVEFLVAGLVNDEVGHGNFVRIASFYDRQGNDEPQFVADLQSKHHRWRLDETQIETYRLSHILNKGLDTWEKLPPRNRKLNFFRFRDSSSFATLICEDLARIDPGQEVLRSIGPDLVIAILMDSAQINERWPARYATVLADDPGSSVLTLTSFALVQRSNEQRIRQAEAAGDPQPHCSSSIGLWKDASIWSSKSIELPVNAEAVLITISNERRKSSTLDGRESTDKKSWLWKLTDQRPIYRPMEEQRSGPAFGRVFHKDGWGLTRCNPDTPGRD